MYMTKYGSCNRPAVATLSTWDPFLRESANFAKIFVSYAHKRDLHAAALLVDPTPAAVVKGESTWPYFQDVATRVRLLQDCGVDAVGVIGFAAPDLDAGAREFFDVVSDEWPLAEFWLRTRQSLGSGAKGSTTAVRTECAQRGWTLRHIKRFISDVGISTRSCLQMGSVLRATSVARTHPTVRRPDSGALRLAWHPGEYRALPASHPGTALTEGETMSVTFLPTGEGMSVLHWPDPSIEYLQFTEGPADLDSALTQLLTELEQAAS